MPSTVEVRPFLPIDLPLVHRLTPFGVSFDSMTTLTRGVHTIEGAVWASMPLTDLGMGTPTFVLRRGESGYVAQIRHRGGDANARMVFVAPGMTHCQDEWAWFRLLDSLTIAAGRRGALTLNAEVAETGPEFPILRQAGFAIYARQELWKREPQPLPQTQQHPRIQLRACGDLDAIALNSLYLNVVPAMVRQADSPPDAKHGLELFHKDRALAYLSAQEGKYGIYLSGLFSPELSTDTAQAILSAALEALPRAEKLPVYFNVRRYAEWLRTPLESLGFAPWANQALMVRHTVRRVDSPLRRTAHVPEGGILALPRNVDYHLHLHGSIEPKEKHQL